VNEQPKAKTSRWAKLASSAAANSLSMDEMSPQRVFLPDFCAIPVVFSVVLIGELLAFILVSAGAGGGPLEPASGAVWMNLAFISLFVQWVCLLSAALLCLLRGILGRLTDVCAGVASFLLVLVVTGLATEIGFRVVQGRWMELELPGSEITHYWFGQGAATAHLELLLGNLVISGIVTAIALRYFYIQHHWRLQLERESEARIQALQSRIRPHFLFNSMNTIAAFTRSDPALAEQVVEDLSDLFRMSLADARVPSTLGRELELCRQYARIEALRLGERLEVRWCVDDVPEQAQLPALTLQPLFENAIYHGVEPATNGGVVTVRGALEGSGPDALVSIELTNSLDPQASLTRRERDGHHMALANVRERLLGFFGSRASMQIEAVHDTFVITLRFPVRTIDEGSGV
jgi:two-component system sensor histidine kinase AlgZ